MAKVHCWSLSHWRRASVQPVLVVLGRQGSMARLALAHTGSCAQLQSSRAGPFLVMLSWTREEMQWLGHFFFSPLSTGPHARK